LFESSNQLPAAIGVHGRLNRISYVSLSSIFRYPVLVVCSVFFGVVTSL